MKKLATLSFALLVALALVVPVVAGDADAMTVEGQMQCAKCTLHQEGLEKCQNVVVVMTEDGGEEMYYLASTAAADEFGEVCRKSTNVRVTGVVEEKDGHMWIAASEIVTLENEG